MFFVIVPKTIKNTVLFNCLEAVLGGNSLFMKTISVTIA